MRIAIITENFLPKLDGVTRTLALLLEHLQSTGHEALLLGPDSGMDGHRRASVVRTKKGCDYLASPLSRVGIAWRRGGDCRRPRHFRSQFGSDDRRSISWAEPYRESDCNSQSS